MTTRRRLLLSAACGLAATQAGLARAQAFPSRSLRWIVPYAAGGGSDVTARIIAEVMKQGLGQSIVIDNRPGAGTIIGTQAMIGSPADGHTVSTADSGTLAYNPSLYEKLPYNIESSFAYIGGIGRMPLVLVTKPGLPVNSVKELIDLARREPGKLTYATAGAGSPHHMAMEMFQQQTGTRFIGVHYKGAAPAVQDVLGGQTDVMMLDIPGGIAHMKAGKLKLLGTAMPKRVSQLPNVPTLTQAGVPDFVAYAWQGMIAPAGTPAAAVAKLDAELQRTLKSAEVQQKLEEMGVEPMPMSAQEFATYAQAEQRRWAKVIKTANIRLD
ncbi:MAG: tripartite tricarboxylate transporter substrate binding protein [Burkholderiales bacterium]|nr:tripartite tricarboxylate transporter substrate binding protein [Burkholderiales bacterium]